MPDSARTRARVNVLLTVSAFVLLLALFAAGGALYGRFQQTNDRRRAQEEINRNQGAVMRKVLCYAEQQTLANKKLTSPQVADAVTFYTNALRLIDQPPCLK